MTDNKRPWTAPNTQKGVKGFVSRPASVRFWEKVKKQESCWEWLGYKTPLGYGYFYLEGRLIPAHRFSYIEENGEPTPGHDIDHLCRNPSCVNPAHLEAVTHRENVMRGMAPIVGRNNHWSKRTHCINGHLFDAANTKIDRDGHRVCKACRRLRDKKRRAALRAANPDAFDAESEGK